MLEIVTIGDERLREETREVTNFDDNLKALVDEMIDTVIQAEGIGLAAPQVGDMRKLFIVRLPEEEPLVFVNPEIVLTSEEVGPYEEGCLSIPGVYREVIRPLEVTVEAQNIKGKVFKIEAKGLLARVIQHENDHLHGMLYIDHLGEKERNKIERKYEKKMKKAKK